MSAKICGKRSRFLCTLEAGHKGAHGRQYRRAIAAEKAAVPKGVEIRTTVEDHGSYKGLTSELILLEKGTFNRFKIGGVPKGEEGRKVDGGPMVPGPWHYVFGLCTVIDCHGGSGAEMDRARAQGRVLEVSDGDVLTIDGLRYAIVKSWNGVLELVEAK